MNARDTAKADKLRKKIADTEAILADLRDKLAKLESGSTGNTAAPAEPPQPSGLDLLWKAALAKSRERSSKQQCRVAWNRIPKAEQPKFPVLMAALQAWNKCEQWTKDANAYAIGLHLFIQRRMWEDVPEVRDPLARYRTPPKPKPPAPRPEEVASEDDFDAILGHLTNKVRTTDELPQLPPP